MVGGGDPNDYDIPTFFQRRLHWFYGIERPPPRRAFFVLE